MAKLEILEVPDPRLRTVAKPVETFDDKLVQLVEDMIETMYAAKGIGLAATQVNVHRRLLVLDVSEEQNTPREYINPEITLTDGTVRLTWADYTDRVARVAHLLTELGVAPGDRVGIHLRRGPRMVVALLAVLEAGAAYVPLDPAYPADRLA